MKKYYYVKLDNYLPVISESKSMCDWYRNINTKLVDGVQLDRDGNVLREGCVVAQGKREAYEKVRRLVG